MQNSKNLCLLSYWDAYHDGWKCAITFNGKDISTELNQDLCLFLEEFEDKRKNFPTLKKIKILFNQLYEFVLKNDICNKDYSTFVEIAQHKDRNPNKHTRTKFSKEEVAKVWTMKEDKYYQIILMLLYNGTRISKFLDLKKRKRASGRTVFQCD